METVKEVFASAPLFAWSIVSILAAATFIVVFWERVRWWWLNTWNKFPKFGRIATLSKDTNTPDEYGWYKAETALCAEYKNFVRLTSAHDFAERNAYLRKARDDGRKPTPKLIWVLIALMVVVEAMGFSYVLAGYAIPGASENTQQVAAMGIAFFVSVLLVGFTHFSGHEIYKWLQVKRARSEWVNAGRPKRGSPTRVSLEQPQNIDDHLPGYEQLWNRVNEDASLFITGVTIALILSVASLATYVRGQVLEKTLAQQTAGQLAESGGATAAPSISIGTTPLPQADLAADREADKRTQAEIRGNDIHGGYATFILLAFLFVFLQILGIIFGWKWGFAGRKSADAYKAVGGYISYSDVHDRYTFVADKAQSMLEALQQKMVDRDAHSGTSGIHPKGSFAKYMEMEDVKAAKKAQEDRQKQNEAYEAEARAKLEQEMIQARIEAERLRLLRSMEGAVAQTGSPDVVPQVPSPSSNLPPAVPAPPAPQVATVAIPVPPAAQTVPLAVPMTPAPQAVPVASSAPPVPPAVPPAVPVDPVMYYLDANRNPVGPIPLSTIKTLVTHGQVPANTMVAEPNGTWKELAWA